MWTQLGDVVQPNLPRNFTSLSQDTFGFWEGAFVCPGKEGEKTRRLFRWVGRRLEAAAISWPTRGQQRMENGAHVRPGAAASLCPGVLSPPVAGAKPA